MTLRKGSFIELKIENMAYGGQGVGRLEGLVIFVKYAVPGDWVRVQVVKRKKDYAEARITDLLEPSKDRIQAPCPYYGFCGGCQWQQVRYECQLAYKKLHVKEAMARIGAFPDVLVHDVIPSKNPYHYRNKMEFSFSDRRWFLPHETEDQKKDLGFALGLHVPGTFHRVIHVEDCLLQHETGNQILREVAKYAEKSNIPAYGLKNHKGFWRFLTLRYSTHFDEWMVNLVTSEERRDVLEPLAEALCRKINNIRTVVNNITAGKAAVAVGEKEIVLRGPGTIQDRLGPFSFQISANSFFQTNAIGAETLYEKVRAFAGLNGTEMVLDLYSGTGTIPIFLSKQAETIIGMEISESAVLDAKRNCASNEVRNCRFICGDIRERLSELRMKPEVLIIDPPRAGIHRDLLAKIMALGTEKIIYVSCNPATMARDLAQMRQGYHIAEIQPVDMFPQTFHIEAIAKLIRYE
ncbi:MAG: 23S rRNA (uracil(1939)-C(5))-methyltransferase RlmD [Deltaproteobacteria bacterium]|nr:23S rRNA (uracil(1939)-C(5))-methyltransferase RlmD [Deltaproteobacteria bacterium]